jgi:hypothetical protein
MKGPHHLGHIPQTLLKIEAHLQYLYLDRFFMTFTGRNYCSKYQSLVSVEEMFAAGSDQHLDSRISTETLYTRYLS